MICEIQVFQQIQTERNPVLEQDANENLGWNLRIFEAHRANQRNPR